MAARYDAVKRMIDVMLDRLEIVFDELSDGGPSREEDDKEQWLLDLLEAVHETVKDEKNKSLVETTERLVAEARRRCASEETWPDVGTQVWLSDGRGGAVVAKRLTNESNPRRLVCLDHGDDLRVYDVQDLCAEDPR